MTDRYLIVKESECTVCKEGIVNFYHRDDPGMLVPFACPNCSGTGKVREEVDLWDLLHHIHTGDKRLD